MVALHGNMSCELYRSAFSGEVVFAVKTLDGKPYEGIAPKHYARPVDNLSANPIHGSLEVRVIKNGGKSARVRMPDGEAIDVPLTIINLPNK
ncbi:MAG: hypothetical protein KAV00_17895 [Phycisphaerae bacterium]|nr:hypothetical protein [Phycisphaerae bacterium]